MATLLESEQMLIRLHHDVLTSVNAVQGDTGRMWNFKVDDYEIPKDAEIRMYIRKPSGKEIYNPGILNDDVISFQPTLQTLAETGQSIGQIQILSNGLSVTTFPFFLNVTENYRLSSSITSKDEFLILDELIEDARVTLEEMKALIKTATTQETARVNAEKKRVTAENARVEAENARKSAETERANAEKSRKTAETSRVNAEKLRVSEENVRKTAESNRVNAETARVNAEKTRVSQENTRKSSEVTRNSNEETRKAKENERLSAETTRKNAETSRVNVEKTRVTAETARVEAEKLRQQNTTTAINKTNDATKKANDAATRAEEALKGLEGAVSGIINDSVSSSTSTYSSKKINSLISAQNIKAITNSQIDSLKNL